MASGALKRQALLWLLIATTVLWGNTLAGHEHLQHHQELCEISSLPHSAQAGSDEIVAPSPVIVRQYGAIQLYRHTSAFASLYNSRAPPA